MPTVEIDQQTKHHLTSIMYSALDKMKASMKDGPGGAPASLTPEESAMVYRTMTEVMGIQHH